MKQFFRLSGCMCATVISIMFSACQVNKSYSNRDSDKADADRFAHRFYELQKSGEFDKLSALYSAEFLKQRGGIDTVQLRVIRERLGDVKEITLEDWRTEVRVGTEASARYDLLYQVVRSKRMARERLSLVKNADSIRIDYYEIEAEGRRYVNGVESDSPRNGQ